MSDSIFFNGFSYHKNSQNAKTIYFRCSKKKTQGCTARLIQKSPNAYIEKGQHSCMLANKITGNDCSALIDDFITNKAADLTKYPSKIYYELLEYIKTFNTGSVFRIPSRAALYSRVYYIRVQGGDSIQNIRRQPLSTTIQGTPFLRRYWFGDFDGISQEFAIWASDFALSILRMNREVFIDATFRITPAPFAQCLIVMAYDPTTNTYVPTVWALMTSKSEDMYCAVIHEIIVLLKYSWEPKTIVADFEKSLQNAIRYEFKKSKLVGCYFHFRQAIQRKINKYKINCDQANLCLNLLKTLVTCDISTINQNIEIIKNDPRLADPDWIPFWNYFSKTWIKTFPPSLWCNSKTDSEGILSRTNNCLERYNRRIGEKFQNAHPNIYSFIAAIKAEENYYAEHINGIRLGKIPFPMNNITFE